MAKKEIQKGAKIDKNKIKTAITDLFTEAPNKLLNYKQIAHALDMRTGAQKQLVIEALNALLEQGHLEQVSYGKFRLNLRQSYVTGTLDRQSIAKKTYLIPDDGGEPIFIAERSMGCALNGDHVNVLLYPRRKNREEEGEVVEVLKRAKTEFVGILEVQPNFAFLNIGRKYLAHNIF